MSGSHERPIARAGDYVLGLMNDAEREPAERDLEIDPDFRDAVVQLAERLHIFDRAEGARWPCPAIIGWLVIQRLAELPQMRSSGLGDDGLPAKIRGLSRP